MAYTVGTKEPGDCCRSGEVIFGKSVLSVARKLTLVIPKLSTSNMTRMSVRLLVRQFCPVKVMPASGGFDVMAKLEAQTFIHNNAAARKYINYLGQDVIRHTWNFLPLMKCSLSTQLLHWEGDISVPRLFQRYKYVGLEYITPTGEGESLSISSHRTSATDFSLVYKAVCDNAIRTRHEVRIPQGMDLVTVDEQWHYVTVEIANVSRIQHSLFWRLSPQNDNVSYILDPEVLPATTFRYPGILTPSSDVFKDITPALARGERFLGIMLTESEASGLLAFRFRALRPVRQWLFATDDWKTIVGNSTNSISQLQITSTDNRCTVQVRIVAHSPGLQFTAFPFGLNPNISHSGFSTNLHERSLISQMSSVFTSDGQKLGISVQVTNATFAYTLQYKVACLSLLPAPTKHWHRAILADSTSFVLLAPSNGCQLQYAVSAGGRHSWRGGHELRFMRLTCMDQTWTVQPQARKIHEANCSTAVVVHIPEFSSLVELSYRMECQNDPNGLPNSRYPITGKLLMATEKWESFKAPPFPDSPVIPFQLDAWTILTIDADCSLEISLSHVDLGSFLITEDFDDLATWNDGGVVGGNVGGAIIGNSRGESLYDAISYASCTDTVFIQFSHPGRQRFGGKYRQRCDALLSPRQSPCSVANMLTANTMWQTIDFSAQNVNHVKQTTFVIAADHTVDSSRNMSIEVQFLSIIQQSFVMVDSDDDGDSLLNTDGRGVLIQSQQASVGHSFAFAANANVTISSSNVALRRGDHVFSARYRLRNAAISFEEQQTGQILFASKKPKVLTLNVPKQFSNKRRRHLLREELKDAYDDEGYPYGEVGMIHLWMARYLWTILPRGGAQCRVVLQFTKMDIGNGHLVRQYTDHQRRLSVQHPQFPGEQTSDPFRSTASCNRDAARTNRRRGTYCARLDQAYVSVSKGSPLVVAFQSSLLGVHPEYESPAVENPEPSSPTSSSGAESTWGSGWSAIYYQDCSNSSTQDIVIRESPRPIQLKAGEKWTRVLAGLPKDGRFLLFQSRQWHIQPARSSARCMVEMAFDCPLASYDPDQFTYYPDECEFQDDHAMAIRYRGHWQSPFQGVDDYGQLASDQWTYEAKYIDLMVFGKRPDFVTKLRFRQVCSRQTRAPVVMPRQTLAPVLPAAAPVALSPPPTRSPTFQTSFAPTSARLLQSDGWNCASDARCLSGRCSRSLEMCMSGSCSTQCSSLHARESCEIYTPVGCACAWSVLSDSEKCEARV